MKSVKRKFVFNNLRQKILVIILVMLWIWWAINHCYIMPALRGTNRKCLNLFAKLNNKRIYDAGFDSTLHSGRSKIKNHHEDPDSKREDVRHSERGNGNRSVLNVTPRPFELGQQSNLIRSNFNSTLFLQEGDSTGFKKSTQTNKRHIIYVCNDDMRCGGWGDRLKGIVSCFVLSKLIDYNFGIVHVQNGVNLTTFFEPNTIDWVFTKTLFRKQEYRYFNFDYSINTRYNMSTIDLRDTFRYKYNFVRLKLNVLGEFKKRNDIITNLQWIFKLHHADIFRNVYHSLFLPKPTLVSDLAVFRKHLDKSRRIICAHFRTGRFSSIIDIGERHIPLSNIGILFDFLRKFNSSSYYIYIASDSDYVRKEAQRKFPNIIDLPGPITHIQRSNSMDVSNGGFKKTLLDFIWLYSECETLVLTESGYGKIASYNRNNSVNLFFMKPSGISSISRYSVFI